MQRSFEQRSVKKSCVKLGKTAAETYEMIDVGLSRRFIDDKWCVQRHKTFLEGRQEFIDEARADRPLTSSSDDDVRRVNFWTQTVE